MKVLFLDIDGVVNHQRTRERFGTYIGVNPHHVAILRRILDATGCSVVLSSSWRLNEPSRQHVRENVCDFIDITPDMQGGKKWGVVARGREVNQWLVDHGQDVEKYAILDDNSDFWPWQPLFQTTFLEGLTNKIADEVIKHLNSGRHWL